MKQKNEQIHTRKLVSYLLIGLIGVLGLVCLYYGSSFAPGSRRSDDTGSRFDGSDPVIGGFSRNRDLVDLLDDQGHYPEAPKSFPVSIAFLALHISKNFSFLLFLTWGFC